MSEKNFECPHCHQPSEADPTLWNQLVICPHCQEQFVPRPKADPEPDPVTPVIPVHSETIQQPAPAGTKTPAQILAEIRANSCYPRIRTTIKYHLSNTFILLVLTWAGLLLMLFGFEFLTWLAGPLIFLYAIISIIIMWGAYLR